MTTATKRRASAELIADHIAEPVSARGTQEFSEVRSDALLERLALMENPRRTDDVGMLARVESLVIDLHALDDGGRLLQEIAVRFARAAAEAE